MGPPVVRVVAEAPRTGLSVPVVQVNRGAPAGDKVAMFTPEGASLEQPPATATSARRRESAPPAAPPEAAMAPEGLAAELLAFLAGTG